MVDVVAPCRRICLLAHARSLMGKPSGGRDALSTSSCAAGRDGSGLAGSG